MKKQVTLFGCGLLMLAVSTYAQDITSTLPAGRKARSFESTTTYRLGRQGVSLGGLNQVLEQAGYRGLSNQFTVFGLATEASAANKPWTLITQFDFALNSTNQSSTNGTNTVRASYFQYGLGVGYRLIRTDKFTLTPKLTLSPTRMGIRITRNDAPAPSLAAALVNPGSQQTATFNSSTFVGDLGLSGQYRFVYKAKTIQTVTDCGTETQTKERSLVVGFDAGYRLSSNSRFNRAVGDQTVNNGGDNTTINLSGWYVAARFGFGTRYRR